jgi:hypothetical protein
MNKQEMSGVLHSAGCISNTVIINRKKIVCKGPNSSKPLYIMLILLLIKLLFILLRVCSFAAFAASGTS